MCSSLISYANIPFEKAKELYIVDAIYQGYFTYSETAWYGRLLNIIDIFQKLGTITWEVVKHSILIAFLVTKAALCLLVAAIPAVVYAFAKFLDFDSQDYWKDKTVFFLNAAYVPPEGVVMHFCFLFVESFKAVIVIVCDSVGMFLPEVGRQGRRFETWI